MDKKHVEPYEELQIVLWFFYDKNEEAENLLIEKLLKPLQKKDIATVKYFDISKKRKRIPKPIAWYNDYKHVMLEDMPIPTINIMLKLDGWSSSLKIIHFFTVGKVWPNFEWLLKELESAILSKGSAIDLIIYKLRDRGLTAVEIYDYLVNKLNYKKPVRRN